MLKQMSNYSFKWVGLYPHNICGPPPSTPDLDIPNGLVLTGMPRQPQQPHPPVWPLPLPLSCASSSRQEGEPRPLCSGPTPSCPGQIWSTVAQELVTVTNIIPRPEAANILNLTLCCSSKVCHDGEPADSTLKASKAIDPWFCAI